MDKRRIEVVENSINLIVAEEKKEDKQNLIKRNVFWKKPAALQAKVKDNKENLEMKMGLGPCRFGKLAISRQQTVGDKT